MKNQKDIKLVNIYIKIHNKSVLTMNDLAYLSMYNPECFQKTCDNLIYEKPEAKTLVMPSQETAVPESMPDIDAAPESESFTMTAEERLQNEQMIQQFFENMKKLELSEVQTLQNVDMEQVRELLGNLFMESLFPHNGLPGYFEMPQEEFVPTFNVKV